LIHHRKAVLEARDFVIDSVNVELEPGHWRSPHNNADWLRSALIAVFSFPLHVRAAFGVSRRINRVPFAVKIALSRPRRMSPRTASVE
jgi:hypothetical protein